MAVQNFYAPLGFAFGKMKSAKKKALKQARQGLLSGRDELLKEVSTTDLIDERTREDFMKEFASNDILNWAIGGGGTKKGVGTAAGILGGFMDLFGQAKEGAMAKFKTRMGIQQIYNSTVDRPDASRLRGQVLEFGSKVRR